MRRVAALLPIAGLAAFATLSQAGRLQTEQGSFRVMQGTDTVAIEQFTRTPTRLDGTLVVPAQVRVVYSADLTPQATVSRVTLSAYRPGATDTMAAQRAVVVFSGDSIFSENTMGDSTQTRRTATTMGAIPYLNPSFALVEQILRRARVIGGDSVSVPVVPSGTNGQTVAATVRWMRPDSVFITLGTTRMRLMADTAGRVLGGGIPDQNVTVTRTSGMP